MASKRLSLCLFNMQQQLAKNISSSVPVGVKKFEDEISSFKKSEPKDCDAKINAENELLSHCAKYMGQPLKFSDGGFLKRLQYAAKSIDEESLKETIGEQHCKTEWLNEANALLEENMLDVLKFAQIPDTTPIEIAEMWFQYNNCKDVIAETLTWDRYEKFIGNAKKYTKFLLPLPSDSKYILLQFNGNLVNFSFEDGVQCLKLMHITDIKHKKIVLIRGEYESQLLTEDQAKWLINGMQKFYCYHDANKLKLMKSFNDNPNEFERSAILHAIAELD